MELDHEYKDMSVFKNIRDNIQNEALFILDEDGVVHEVTVNDNGTHNCHQKIDFSEHNLKEIIDDDWGRAHINNKAIIYKETVYLRQSEFTKNTIKTFNWSLLTPYLYDSMPNSNDEVHPLVYVEGINHVSAMLAIGN